MIASRSTAFDFSFFKGGGIDSAIPQAFQNQTLGNFWLFPCFRLASVTIYRSGNNWPWTRKRIAGHDILTSST
jgi:hypothetical protein